MNIDFSSFRPSLSRGMWYADNLTDSELAKLPKGKEFTVLLAPMETVTTYWQVIRYRVGTALNTLALVTKGKRVVERVYFVVDREVLEQSPFEGE